MPLPRLRRVNPINNVLSNLQLRERRNNQLKMTRKKRPKSGFTGVTKNVKGPGYTAELRGVSLGTFRSAAAAKAYRIGQMRREDLDVFADLETEVDLTESDVEYLNNFEGKRRICRRRPPPDAPGTSSESSVARARRELRRARGWV